MSPIMVSLWFKKSGKCAEYIIFLPCETFFRVLTSVVRLVLQTGMGKDSGKCRLPNGCFEKSVGQCLLCVLNALFIGFYLLLVVKKHLSGEKTRGLLFSPD